MKIRTYRDSDKESVIRLISSVLKEFGLKYSRQLDRDLSNVQRYYFRKGRAHGGSGKFWILEDGGKVVGTLAVSRINDRVCKLRRFYIVKKYRHLGWGLKLYRKALVFIRRKGYREIWTSTTAKFKDSIRFQERAGFKRTKRVLWPYKRAGIFHILKLR